MRDCSQSKCERNAAKRARRPRGSFFGGAFFAQRARKERSKGSLDVGGVAIALMVCAVVAFALLILITTGLGEFRRTIDIKLEQEEQGGLLRAMLASTGAPGSEVPARWLRGEPAMNAATVAQQAAEITVGGNLAVAERTLEVVKQRVGADGMRLSITADGKVAAIGDQAPRVVRTYVAEVPLPGGTGQRGEVRLAVL